MSQDSEEPTWGCGFLLIILGIVLCFTWTREALEEMDYDSIRQSWSSELAYPPPPPKEEPVVAYSPPPEEMIVSYTEPTDIDPIPHNPTYSGTSSDSFSWSSALKSTGEFLKEHPEVVVGIICLGFSLFGDSEPDDVYFKPGGGGQLQPYDPATGQYK